MLHPFESTSFINVIHKATVRKEEVNNNDESIYIAAIKLN